MRRFWAFIVMVASLLVMICFNVQAIYESNNLSLTYSGGTETVLNITKRDDGDPLSAQDIADKITARLDTAGARDSKVVVDIQSDTKAQARVTLQTQIAVTMKYMLWVVEGNQPLTFTTVNDFEVDGDTIFGDVDERMTLTYSGTTATVRFNIGDTTDWDSLVADAKKAKNEADQKTILVWQNKAKTDTYDLALGTKKRADVAKKIIATLSTDDYKTDNGNYITVSKDAEGNAFNTVSARAYVQARNADDYGFDIDYVYDNLLPETTQTSSYHLSMIGALAGLLLLWAALVLAYGLSGAISGLSSATALMFTMMIANFLGFEFTPVTIMAGCLAAILSAFMSANFFKRIKEEIRRGKTIDKACFDGYRKSFPLTLAAAGFVNFLALFTFLIGRGLIKTFCGVVMIGSLLDFIFGNYLTKWMMYWLTTSTVFAKTGRDFGLSDKLTPLEKFASKKGDVQEPKLKKKRVASYVLCGLISAACLGGFLVFGLTKGDGAMYNNSGDYGSETRLDITYMTEDSLSKEQTFFTIDSFEKYICDTKAYVEKDNIETYTFNRVSTLDDEALSTLTTYVSLKLKSPISDEKLSALSLDFQAGTDLNMIPSSYAGKTLISQNSRTLPAISGKSVHDNFWMYLSIGLIPAFALAFVLIVHGLYASLAAAYSETLTFGFAMGLLVLSRLPFNSLAMYGVLMAMFASMFAYLPFFSRLREAKRDSNIKRPGLSDRFAFADQSLKAAWPTMALPSLMTAFLGLVFICFSWSTMLTAGLMMILVSFFSLYVNFNVLPYAYLDIIRVLKFKPINPAALKKPIVAPKNEPHETIVPGIND